MVKYHNNQKDSETGLGGLAWRHVDRMSYNLKQAVEGKYRTNVELLGNYYFQIGHYENTIHPVLDKEYYSLVEGIKAKISTRLLYTRQVPDGIKFFDQMSVWLKLLQTKAFNSGLIAGEFDSSHDDDAPETEREE